MFLCGSITFVLPQSYTKDCTKVLKGLSIQPRCMGEAEGLASLIPKWVPSNDKLLLSERSSLRFLFYSCTRSCVHGSFTCKIKIPSALAEGSNLSLRREGDSNPRYSYPYGSLANCWFKPLTNLSKKKSTHPCPLPGGDFP